MSETQVGHPTHTLPGEYSIGEIILGEELALEETQKALQRGEGPEYEVLMATYPRAGTSRIVEIAWLLMNNVDIEKAKEVPQTGRHLFLDMCDSTFKSIYGKPLQSSNFPLTKTHLPYRLMEAHANRNTKIIVGLRNPKDNLVSVYHFYRMNKCLGNFKGSFTEFFSLVKAKHVMYGDVFDFSVGWWSIKNRPNTMYVFFEDLTEDPVREVCRMAQFLDVDVTEYDVMNIIKWTSFGNMRANESTNNAVHRSIFNFEISHYMRKGTVGDWKIYISEEESVYLDDQYSTKCVPVGLKFRFEL